MISVCYRLLDRIDDDTNLKQDGLFRTELKRYLLSLSDFIKGKRVLDVGSGPWTWVRERFGKECDLICIDTSPHPSADIIGSVYELDHLFSNTQPFDVVLATEVFEHLPDSLSALKQIHGVLAPGGTLIISTPFKKDLHGEDYGDYWRITRQGWQYLLAQSGFELISLSWLGEELFPIAYFIRAERKTL